MVSFGSKIPARENWWIHLDRVTMAGNSQKLSNWVLCCCCCCCWRVKTFSSSKERKIKAQTCPNLPLLTLSILNIPTHKYTNTGCLECSTGSQMTHRFLSYLDEGADAPWHNEGGFVVCSHFFLSLQRHRHAHIHRHAHTHRLPWTPLKWPEAPRDDDIIGFDGRRALEGAPQTNVCAVDRLNLLRCVYTHPADLQHACNMWA